MTKTRHFDAQTFWSWTKSVAILAIIAVIVKVTFFGVEPDYYDPENTTSESNIIYGKDVPGNTSNGKVIVTDKGTYYSTIGNGLVIPYSSIYDVQISESQLLKVQELINHAIVKQAERDIPNGSPNEKILRYAWYNATETEAALNEALGVTLSTDWHTDDVYVPSQATNQQQYSYNGLYAGE